MLKNPIYVIKAILSKKDIATIGHQIVFKSCARFTKSITKNDGATVDDGEDLDLVIPMYNLIEYSSN